MSAARWCAGLPLFLVLGALAAPGVAAAAAVPGATYTGTAGDGATVTLTVSSDGTTVTSYSVLGILGTDANGQTCQGTAEETKNSAWPGASITNNSFTAAINSTFTITGVFDGAQSVSGTFNFSQAPIGIAAGCSTGSVAWSATTSATSGGGSGSGSGGSSTGGSSPGGSSVTGASKAKLIGVRVSLRRQAQRKLLGALTKSAGACVARRRVYLWAGHRGLGSSRATAAGAFSFKIRKAWQVERIHASVRRLRTTSGVCTGSTSKTVEG